MSAATDKYRAIIAAQQRQVDALVRSQGVGPVRRMFMELLEQLTRQLAKVNSGTFTEVQLRGMVAQVKAVLVRFVGSAAGEVDRAAQIVAVNAARNAFGVLEAMERVFADAVVAMPLPEIARLRGFAPAASTLLRVHQRSMARYGAHFVGVIEQTLSTGLALGESSSLAIDRIAAAGDLEWWRAERIVRTELSYVYNASTRETVAAESAELGGDVWSLWSEHCDAEGRPLDDRVAVDSIAMHGQVAPTGGLFTMPPSAPFPDTKGRTAVPPALIGQTWDHPPNRPNDRSTLSPWRAHWGIPGWIWRGGRRVPVTAELARAQRAA